MSEDINKHLAEAMMNGLATLISNKIEAELPQSIDVGDAVHDYFCDGLPDSIDDAIAEKVIEVLDYELEQRISDWMGDNLPDRIKISIE